MEKKNFVILPVLVVLQHAASDTSALYLQVPGFDSPLQGRVF
jgi:hypothetical protein